MSKMGQLVLAVMVFLGSSAFEATPNTAIIACGGTGTTWACGSGGGTT